MTSYAQILENSLESSTYASIFERTGIHYGVEQWKGQGLFRTATLVAVAVGWVSFCICGAIYRRMILN